MIPLLTRLFRRKTAPVKLEPAELLAGLRPGPGGIAIDCGANVGDVSELLAAGGATVYAFEPNPHAFEVLQRRFAGRPNVVCLNQAVLDRPGRVRLYLHQRAREDQVHWSQGSSLLEIKGNIDRGNHVEVEAVDLAEFIRGLGAPVDILKIDVEGVECRLLTRLIESGLAAGIKRIFVETHEQKIPALRAEVEALRRLIARRGLANIDLDWH